MERSLLFLSCSLTSHCYGVRTVMVVLCWRTLGGTGQGLKCLGRDSALCHPSKEEQLKLQGPQTHSRHTCTHTQARLLPENPLPAAPAPSEAAQEWGPHSAVRRGPSGRRHSRGSRATTQPGAFADQPSTRPAEPTGRWTKLSLLPSLIFFGAECTELLRTKAVDGTPPLLSVPP